MYRACQGSARWQIYEGCIRVSFRESNWLTVGASLAFLSDWVKRPFSPQDVGIRGGNAVIGTMYDVMCTGRQNTGYATQFRRVRRILRTERSSCFSAARSLKLDISDLLA
jgi:hypothetical protein